MAKAWFDGSWMKSTLNHTASLHLDTVFGAGEIRDRGGTPETLPHTRGTRVDNGFNVILINVLSPHRHFSAKH